MLLRLIRCSSYIKLLRIRSVDLLAQSQVEHRVPLHSSRMERRQSAKLLQLALKQSKSRQSNPQLKVYLLEKFPQSYSGCVLGWIHHLDPRAPAPLTGMAVQKEGLCSLQWSPGGEWLASGSTDGLLSIWDSDITGHTSVRGPTTTMKQPSAVKVRAACESCNSVRSLQRKTTKHANLRHATCLGLD